LSSKLLQICLVSQFCFPNQSKQFLIGWLCIKERIDVCKYYFISRKALANYGSEATYSALPLLLRTFENAFFAQLKSKQFCYETFFQECWRCRIFPALRSKFFLFREKS